MHARQFPLSCLLAILLGGAPAGNVSAEEPEPAGRTGSPSSRYYSDLAAVHLRHKVYGQAVECLQKAIELEENSNVSADHAFQLAKIYLEWGRDTEAEAMFQYSLGLTPDASSLINRSRELARFYESKQMFDKAEDVYGRAVARSEGATQRGLRRELFRMHQASGKLAQVIAAKEQELPASEDAKALLNDLAYMYRLSGQPDKEREAYQKLAGADPTDQSALFQLAVAYRDSNEVDKAVQTYEKLVKINPPAEPYYVSEIIKLYTNAGRAADAKKWLDQLVSPQDLETAAGQARLARLRYELKQYDRTVEHYTRAVELAPQPREKEHYQLQLARTLQLLDKLDEAETICKELLGSQNKSVTHEAQVIIGRIHQRRQSLKK